jgi:hypothetical protein
MELQDGIDQAQIDLFTALGLGKQRPQDVSRDPHCLAIAAEMQVLPTGQNTYPQLLFQMTQVAIAFPTQVAHGLWV